MSDASEVEKQDEVAPEETEEKTEDENSDEEEKKEEPLHLHTKTIPPIVMLFGGAAAAIFTFVRHDPLLTSLEIIFVALVIFLVLGDLIKILLDTIQIVEPEEKTGDEDRVIERSSGEEAGETEEESAPGEEVSTEEIES